jgi:hypothetical protein
MTKEEIQKVLALSLEYYKSEVFGTDKESKKSSHERIDWIYDKLKGSLETPNDLEEAADWYEKKHTYQRYDGGGLTPEYDATLAEAVIFGAKWQKEQDEKELSEKIAAAYQLGLADKEKQMMKEFPKWKKIKTGERLPCPAYVWAIAYDNYPDCFQGRLIPNIQGVKVGQDTWYLPVDVIHDLPKEDE